MLSQLPFSYNRFDAYEASVKALQEKKAAKQAEAEKVAAAKRIAIPKTGDLAKQQEALRKEQSRISKLAAGGGGNVVQPEVAIPAFDTKDARDRGLCFSFQSGTCKAGDICLYKHE